MSREYKKGSDVPSEVISSRLRELSDVITKPAMSRTPDWSEFYMRIPAQVDRDADLVLCEAARRIESLEKRVKELDDRLLDKQNANKALFSIYDESEVENNLLKDKVKELEADNKRKAKVLVDVRNLIERHDIDVFGSNTDGKLEWPLSAEVIDDITKAL